MPMRSTFEISTQIILLKIDGFLKGWILNITPLKNLDGICISPNLYDSSTNLDQTFAFVKNTSSHSGGLSTLHHTQPQVKSRGTFTLKEVKYLLTYILQHKSTDYST